MTTFESFREVTGWKRPGHDHGCAPVQVVPGVWTAHYHDIDSIEKLKAATGGAPITLFEATTCAALLAFAREPADFTLLEVGMGGRLDATNVAALQPALCVSDDGLRVEMHTWQCASKRWALQGAMEIPGGDFEWADGACTLLSAPLL